MSLFVIAKQDDPDLITPIFYAGHDLADEAVAIFTTHDRAENYIHAAGWQDEDTVAELQPAAVLRWLISAADSGAEVVTVDPSHTVPQESPQPALSIPNMLNEIAQSVTGRIHSAAPGCPTRLVAMDMLHCQKCGKLIEQESGITIPTCCGQVMALAAGDSREHSTY